MLRSIEDTPIAATRVYAGPDFTVRERIFVPVTRAAATISYTVDSHRPILITVHFTPSLNLMWPGAVGGQEIHWDATRSAYTLDEPSRRFRGAIVSRQIVAHEQIQNNRRDAELERSITFTMRAAPGPTGDATVAFAGASASDENPLIIATNLMAQAGADEALARERYAGLSVIDVETPDSTVNRALRWAQVTLSKPGCATRNLAAACSLGTGHRAAQHAGRSTRGSSATMAWLRWTRSFAKGAYARARDELSFIMRYQNKRTGAIWHELSQSAGFLRSGARLSLHVCSCRRELRLSRHVSRLRGDSG